MPRAIFDSDRQSTEDWLSKAINLLGVEDKELLLSLTDCCNPNEDDDDVTYIGLLYTNCMSWEGDVVVCPLVATANHSCRPNAQFVPRLDKGGKCHRSQSYIHLKMVMIFKKNTRIFF